MLSESAIGRISAGARPARARAARYAEAPPWPTEAYMNAATSIPADSSVRTSGSIAAVYQLHRALGKNNGSPLILYSAMVFWPSGEINQSTKAWPIAFFTFG